jgi:rhamnosyl/mannosyltransferase
MPLHVETTGDTVPTPVSGIDGRRLRVLHVGKYYPPVPGGMERVLQLLCERERARVDCSVLVAGTERVTRRESARGVPVTRAGSLARVGSVGLSPALPRILRATPSDVTVIHEPNPMALVADAITFRRGALLVYFHSEVVRPQWMYRVLYRPFLERVLDRADRIVVASPAMRDTAGQLEGYRHKTVVIPYGIEPASLAAPAAVAARARDIRGASSSSPLLLFVGRLVPYKGVEVLIRALRDTPARLAVVGDGPLRRSLERLAADVGVADRVTFAGAVPDEELLAHYHACDALVLPSITRAEAFGMVQLEAMACSRPVVSTDLPSGVPWVNRHGESGLVVPPGDVPALAAALRLLAGDAALRERLGAGARRRVEAEFTASRMAERTVGLYEEVLAERARSRHV